MLTKKQEDLYKLMSDISEGCYCAGWMDGNEERLWKVIVDDEDDRRYGHGEITLEQIEKLKALSVEIGGWIYWNDDSYEPGLDCKECGPRFMASHQWVARYSRF